MLSLTLINLLFLICMIFMVIQVTRNWVNRLTIRQRMKTLRFVQSVWRERRTRLSCVVTWYAMCAESRCGTATCVGESSPRRFQSIYRSYGYILFMVVSTNKMIDFRGIHFWKAPDQRHNVNDKHCIWITNVWEFLLLYRIVLNYSTCNVFCVTVQLCGDLYMCFFYAFTWNNSTIL